MRVLLIERLIAVARTVSLAALASGAVGLTYHTITANFQKTQLSWQFVEPARIASMPNIPEPAPLLDDSDVPVQMTEKFKRVAELWGKLPEKERTMVRVGMTRNLDPRYREVIEAYFKIMSSTVTVRIPKSANQTVDSISPEQTAEKLKSLSKAWGKLPRKDWTLATASMTHNLDPRHREAVQAYFKMLSSALDGK